MVSASCDPIISHHIPLYPIIFRKCIQLYTILRCFTHISIWIYLYISYCWKYSISHETFPWPFCPGEVPTGQAFCDWRKQPRPRSAWVHGPGGATGFQPIEIVCFKFHGTFLTGTPYIWWENSTGFRLWFSLSIQWATYIYIYIYIYIYGVYIYIYIDT